MRVKRRVTAPEFEAVRPLLNISEERIEAARAVLVEGQRLQAVANRYGWSRQAVHDTVSVVWRTFQRYQEAQTAAVGEPVPPGWERVTLVAPADLIARFRAEIAAAVEQSGETAGAGKRTRKTPHKKPGAHEGAPGEVST